MNRIHKIRLLWLCLVLVASSASAQGPRCVPDDVPSGSRVTIHGASGHAGPVALRKGLKMIGAKCSKQKLVDRKGREIRFYFLQGCWGNPPADQQDILNEQRNEIAALAKRYSVLEVSCETSTGGQLQAVP